ncbi:MAG: hypothetical protein IPL61_23045 [Myxococcales bacterium]|nr:hypothetical protein [Myxococcales bacterium]
MRVEGSPSDRLQEALDLFDFGVSMMAARLRREHPEESPEQLARRLDAWLIRHAPEPASASDAPTGQATSPLRR